MDAEGKTAEAHDLNRLKRLAHIGRLSAGIGHNLMTPLSLIMMNSDLLALKIQGQETLQKHLNEITQQASQISRIVENIMWKVSVEEQETPTYLQIGSLVKENVQFWMGDMFFKHKLEKTFQIKVQTPPLKGVPFHFTSFMDEWIAYTIDRARPQDGGKLRIVVDTLDEMAFYLLFEDSLPLPTSREKDVLVNGCASPFSENYFPALCCLLRHYPAKFEVSIGQNPHQTSLRLTWTLQ